MSLLESSFKCELTVTIEGKNMGSNAAKQVSQPDEDEDVPQPPTPVPQPQSPQPQPQPQSPQSQSPQLPSKNNAPLEYQKAAPSSPVVINNHYGSIAPSQQESALSVSQSNSAFSKMNSADSAASGSNLGSSAQNSVPKNVEIELSIEQLKQTYNTAFTIIEKKIEDDLKKNPTSPHNQSPAKKQAHIQKQANLALNEEFILNKFFNPEVLKKYDYSDKKPEKSYLKINFIVSDLGRCFDNYFFQLFIRNLATRSFICALHFIAN